MFKKKHISSAAPANEKVAEITLDFSDVLYLVSLVSDLDADKYPSHNVKEIIWRCQHVCDDALRLNTGMKIAVKK